MLFFRRRHDDADTLIKAEEKPSEPEWREPPGRLGEYVRRVKRMAGATARQQME